MKSWCIYVDDEGTDPEAELNEVLERWRGEDNNTVYGLYVGYNHVCMKPDRSYSLRYTRVYIVLSGAPFNVEAFAPPVALSTTNDQQPYYVLTHPFHNRVEQAGGEVFETDNLFVEAWEVLERGGEQPLV